MSQARRSMSQALQTANLTPEALAFIKEGTPKSKVGPPVLFPDKEEEAPSREEKAPPAEVPPLLEEAEKKSKIAEQIAEPEEAQSAKPKKAKTLKEPSPAEAVAVPPVGFVSTSFRLPAEIPSALVRASADRKVKRVKPWSHQDIVAEALTQWLKKSGYL